mgnify:CR=1 FL=1
MLFYLVPMTLKRSQKLIKNSYMNYIIVILTFVSLNVQAQSDEAAVKHTINSLFEGMKKSDTALMRLAFSKDAMLQTITKTKEGNTLVRSEVVDSFLVAIARPHPEIYEERISFEVVKIDADLAIAWTPYKFYVGEKFSHCGVNSFQLVKFNGEWKIQYLIDTRRRQGCE